MGFLLFHGLDNAAERTPQQEAVRIWDRSISYGELAGRSNALARVLAENGVRRGDRVGILQRKGIEAVVALYGIMKAGAAYVPLDMTAPADRHARIVADCGLDTLVATPESRSSIEQLVRAGGGALHVVGIEEGSVAGVRATPWSAVEKEVESGQRASAAPVEDDLAYILYTSGSTGVPKGIMHSHRSALAFAEWGCTKYGLRADDSVSNHAPLHFDLSTFDYFATAIAGARTVVIPEEVTRLPASLSELMQDERITVWYSVPSALIQLLERGDLRRRKLDALRWVLFAGEPFPTKHLRTLMELLPGVAFANLYGPTETNVCTSYELTGGPPTDDQPIPIGHPCDNTEAIVVDEADREVAPGAVGELLVRGAVVMKGYWGRPDLNDRAFYKRHAAPGLEQRYYRTGDLVRLGTDGEFSFLGRKDRQVKVRGFRVELDEIEVALLSHGAVAEAAVYPIPGEAGIARVEAAVILRPGMISQAEQLQAHLAQRLPPQAMPSEIRLVADFPRTSTGKIDRNRLRDHLLAAGGKP